MHPRNLYREAPDFIKLASEYPELKQFIKLAPNGATIDYRNQSALRCLTQALLHRDFGILITLPEDRLCPPVPNRLNYILWLQDVLDATDLPSSADNSVQGIDIGTGASAIYPLLGCSTNTTWNFYATEIDETSLTCARQNVVENHLEARITVLQANFDSTILPCEVFEQSSQLDFTMCNPPFYRNREEISISAEAKQGGPNAVCTGADTEMITPGGEVSFVRQMVLESLRWSTRCRWFTSMLGKMSSLTEIVELLKVNKIGNYGITEFVQGRTRRWAIAWSFGRTHLPDSLARIPNPALQGIMPQRNTFRQLFAEFQSKEAVDSALTAVLRGVDGVSIDSAGAGTGKGVLVQTMQNTWSRAARRRRTAGTTPSIQDEHITPVLRCRIRCLEVEPNARVRSQGGDIIVQFDWVEGDDRGLFESFISHVSRKLKEIAKASDVDMKE